MTINRKDDGGKTIISLEGELDLQTAPELAAYFDANLADVKDLEMDFSQLKYLSSAGMRVILSAKKTMNKQGPMCITHVNDMVMEIFEAAGFDAIIDISK